MLSAYRLCRTEEDEKEYWSKIKNTNKDFLSDANYSNFDYEELAGLPSNVNIFGKKFSDLLDLCLEHVSIISFSKVRAEAKVR